MSDDPTFVVTLTPEVVTRLGFVNNQFEQVAYGWHDLWAEHLEPRKIGYDDVHLITLKGESDEERAVGDAVRTLERNGNVNIYLGIEPYHIGLGYVYLIASVLHGGLVEYQVSNGRATERGMSFDCYRLSEAKQLFSQIVEKGWYQLT